MQRNKMRCAGKGKTRVLSKHRASEDYPDPDTRHHAASSFMRRRAMSMPICRTVAFA